MAAMNLAGICRLGGHFLPLGTIACGRLIITSGVRILF